MNVPHLFRIANDDELYDDGPRNEIYVPEVTPGCEPVLEGKGEACRMYDGPFVLVENGKPYELGQYTRREITHKDTLGKGPALWEAWTNLDIDYDKPLPQPFDGLYQLIEEEVECPMCDTNGLVSPGGPGAGWAVCVSCKGSNTITHPRLVRVGEEKPFDERDTWPNWGAPYTPESLIYLLQGGFHKTGPFHDWHGILWRWEVECPKCGGEGKRLLRDVLPPPDPAAHSRAAYEARLNYQATIECGACRGTGRITHYAKVERRLLP